MHSNLTEIETKFNTLKTLASSLAAYEKSGFKNTLETFETTLAKAKGIKQSPSTLATLNPTLDAAITQVDSWIKSEQRELSISDQPIKELQAKLLRRLELLTLKKISAQQAETEQKQANDTIENTRAAPDDAARQASALVDTSLQAYGIKTDVQNEADLTLLKGQLGALEVTLLQASHSLKETGESALKNGNRIRNLRGEITKLTPGTPAMEAKMALLGKIWIEIQPVLEALPEPTEAPIDFDVNASFYGTAFLDAMKSGQGVTGFYKKAKEVSDSHELTALKAENIKLKTELNVARSDTETLTTEKAELVEDLARELDEGTKLATEVAALKDSLAVEQGRVAALTTENTGLYETNASNQKGAKEINAQKIQAETALAELTAEYETEQKITEQVFEQNRKVIKENERLVENLEKEVELYNVREKELLGEIEKAKSETAEVALQIAQHQHQYSTLESRLKQAREDLAEAEKGRKSALATIKEYEVEYPEALAEAEEKVQKAEAALAKNEAQLEQLKSTLSEAKTKIAALSERNAILEKETLYEHFKTEATEKIVECDQLKKQLGKQKAEYKAEVHTLLNEINKLQKRISDLNAIDRHADSQHLKIETLEREIKRLQGLRVLDARPMGKDNRITPDAVMLQQAEDQVKGLSNANVALQAQLAAANARIKALEQTQITHDAPTQTAKAQESDEPIKPQKLDATDGILIGTGLAGTALCVAAAVITAIGLFAAWPLAVAGAVIGLGGYLVWNHLKNSKSEEAEHETHPALPQARDALVVKPAIENRIPASAPRMLTV